MNSVFSLQIDSLRNNYILMESSHGQTNSFGYVGSKLSAEDGWKQGSFASTIPPVEEESMSWKEAFYQFVRETLSLPHIFWVLVILCVVVYGCVLPFNNIESSLLLERDYFKSPPSGIQLI